MAVLLCLIAALVLFALAAFHVPMGRFDPFMGALFFVTLAWSWPQLHAAAT